MDFFLKIHCVSHCIMCTVCLTYKTAMNANHIEDMNSDLPSCSIYCDLWVENFVTILKIFKLFYDYLKP